MVKRISSKITFWSPLTSIHFHHNVSFPFPLICAPFYVHFGSEFLVFWPLASCCLKYHRWHHLCWHHVSSTNDIQLSNYKYLVHKWSARWWIEARKWPTIHLPDFSVLGVPLADQMGFWLKLQFTPSKLSSFCSFVVQENMMERKEITDISHCIQSGPVRDVHHKYQFSPIS